MKRSILRSCLGCGEQTERGDLVRVSVSEEGVLRCAQKKVTGARGGYLHPRQECVRKFFKRKRLSKTFRRDVQLPEVGSFLMDMEAHAESCRGVWLP